MSVNLEHESRMFAERLNEILNGTVCNGPKVKSVFVPDRQQAWIGYGISKMALETEKAIPVCISGKPRLFLDLSYRLSLVGESDFLTVDSSYIGLYLNAEMSHELCHFDYERDKVDGYPEAHMQMHAASKHWSALIAATTQHGQKPRALDALHFPVGGRRFRPALEDIVEFLVVERFVKPRNDWQSVLDGFRDEFREKQLRAAIRTHPEIAEEELAAIHAEGKSSPNS